LIKGRKIQIEFRIMVFNATINNISVYRLQPRLFIDSLPYLKTKTKGP
jgi:hypothetical protein